MAPYLSVVRPITRLRWQDSLAERLAQTGWEVQDLEFGRMSVVGDFADFTSAQKAAARDLRSGAPVSHRGGGFVVGHDGVAPQQGGLVPAYVIWPDGEERRVETREELARALRERLVWQCDRAREVGLDGVDAGREAAVRAIDVLAAGGELTTQARGPVFHAACSVWVDPVAHLRWSGFQHGLEGWEGPAAEQRRHPILYEFDGAFTDVWREGSGWAPPQRAITSARQNARS